MVAASRAILSVWLSPKSCWPRAPQSAPIGLPTGKAARLLLRFGTPEQRERYLPGIASGQSYFSIGMSEPDTGSDLASVRTTAVAEGDAYRINGTKIWTTDAHRNHYIICLVRTEAPSENRHAGFLPDHCRSEERRRQGAPHQQYGRRRRF